MDIGVPTAAHFIFIPAVLIIGVVIGWNPRLTRRAGRDRLGAAQARGPRQEISDLAPVASRGTSGSPSSRMRA
jgi:hypothetical protein